MNTPYFIYSLVWGYYDNIAVNIHDKSVCEHKCLNFSSVNT